MEKKFCENSPTLVNRINVILLHGNVRPLPVRVESRKGSIDYMVSFTTPTYTSALDPTYYNSFYFLQNLLDGKNL